MATESITTTQLSPQQLAVPRQESEKPVNSVAQVLPSQPTEKVEPKRQEIKIDTQPVGTAEEIGKAIEQVQVMMDLRNRSVSFSQDTVSGREVIQVKNEQTGEVIRQMPAEELLAFMRNLTRMLGTFFDKSS
jgi:flagellar protein FlaG|tara:strand:- start:42 stop:437 length:396 start_codon:yes stop_codon:yes gene_type:complete